MAPRTKDDFNEEDDWGPPGATTGASDEVPEAQIDPSRSPFLKPYHLKKDQGTLELVSVGPSTEYSDIVLHVKVDGTAYRMGLRNFDPGFVALRKKFGAKKSDWHGTLRYRVMPHKGNTRGFVAVRP